MNFQIPLSVFDVKVLLDSFYRRHASVPHFSFATFTMFAKLSPCVVIGRERYNCE
jgi:hypothetical protein